MTTFCPATMCPLFAADGSPWTGDVNAICEHSHEKCGWWDGERLPGNRSMRMQATTGTLRVLVEALASGDETAGAALCDCLEEMADARLADVRGRFADDVLLIMGLPKWAIPVAEVVRSFGASGR